MKYNLEFCGLSLSTSPCKAKCKILYFSTFRLKFVSVASFPWKYAPLVILETNLISFLAPNKSSLISIGFDELFDGLEYEKARQPFKVLVFLLVFSIGLNNKSAELEYEMA